MDIEKVVNSKWYSAFDWIYKLILMNMLTMIISMLFGIVPFLLFLKTGFGILVYIAIMLTIYGFIPCYITNLKVIKATSEDKKSGVIKIYFIELWDSFKKTYLLGIIFEIVLSVLIYGGNVYWQYLESETFQMDIYGIVSIVGYWVVVMGVIFIVFAFMHLPFVITYFKMRVWTYIKASFFMSFKYFFKTLAFVFITILPFMLLILLAQNLMLIIITLIGFTGPQYLIYKIGRPTYWYLSHNISDIKTEDKYDFKGENDDENWD